LYKTALTTKEAPPVPEREGGEGGKGRTHPHLGSLNLPFVAVALPPAPLGLQVVQDAGERHLGFARLDAVLAGRLRGAGLLLLLRRRLLVRVAALRLLGVLPLVLGLHRKACVLEGKRRERRSRPRAARGRRERWGEKAATTPSEPRD
jgi:hypothetical protein